MQKEFKLAAASEETVVVDFDKIRKVNLHDGHTVLSSCGIVDYVIREIVKPDRDTPNSELRKAHQRYISLMNMIAEDNTYPRLTPVAFPWYIFRATAREYIGADTYPILDAIWEEEIHKNIPIEYIREFFTSGRFGKPMGSFKRKYVWSHWCTYVRKADDEIIRQRFYDHLHKDPTQQNLF